MFKILLVVCELGMPERVCTPTGDHMELIVPTKTEYATENECFIRGMTFATAHVTPEQYVKVYCLPLKGQPA